MEEHVQLQPGETIILKFRKHWWTLFTQLLPVLVIGVLPFALLFAVLRVNLLPSWITPALIAYVSAWWLLVIWSTIAVQWTIYYLTVWIVTDRRILNAEQRGLFHRETTTWLLDKVQEVTVDVDNILGTLMGFGTIEVQTAGPTDDYAKIVGVRNPEDIQKTIMAQVEKFTESRGPDRVSER